MSLSLAQALNRGVSPFYPSIYFFHEIMRQTTLKVYFVFVLAYATLFGLGVMPYSVRDQAVVGYLFVVLFAIVGFSGVMPELMQKGKIEIFLSRPYSRSALHAGVLFGGFGVFVLAATAFFTAVWVAYGLGEGSWESWILSRSITLSISFLPILCYIVFMGVLTRNTGFVIVAVFGYVFFVAPMLGFSALEGSQQPGFWGHVSEVVHKALPQPHPGVFINLNRFLNSGKLDAIPIAATLASGIVAYLISVRLFRRIDF